MKKLLLVGLMMLAGSAWAEWVIYSQIEEITFYFDPATIRKDGNMLRIWKLQELKRRHEDGYMSRRMRLEYGCKQERCRILAASTHSEPMAGGEVLGSAGDDSWQQKPVRKFITLNASHQRLVIELLEELAG